MENTMFLPLTTYRQYPLEEMRHRVDQFRVDLQRRRSVRQFSKRAVPQDIIEDCLLAAGSAPSGANLQPWHFVVVKDAEKKSRIRSAAEQEEHEFYHSRAS